MESFFLIYYLLFADLSVNPTCRECPIFIFYEFVMSLWLSQDSVMIPFLDSILSLFSILILDMLVGTIWLRLLK